MPMSRTVPTVVSTVSPSTQRTTWALGSVVVVVLATVVVGASVVVAATVVAGAPVVASATVVAVGATVAAEATWSGRASAVCPSPIWLTTIPNTIAVKTTPNTHFLPRSMSSFLSICLAPLWAAERSRVGEQAVNSRVNSAAMAPSRHPQD